MLVVVVVVFIFVAVAAVAHVASPVSCARGDGAGRHPEREGGADPRAEARAGATSRDAAAAVVSRGCFIRQGRPRPRHGAQRGAVRGRAGACGVGCGVDADACMRSLSFVFVTGDEEDEEEDEEEEQEEEDEEEEEERNGFVQCAQRVRVCARASCIANQGAPSVSGAGGVTMSPRRRRLTVGSPGTPAP